MRSRLSLHLAVLAATTLAVCVSVSAQTPGAKRDADKMQQTLEAIMERASTSSVKGRTAPPLKSTFTDAQFNSWLLADGKDNVPVGLLQPVVTFLAAGKLTAKAIVDLDAVRKSKPRGMLDPMNLLSGMVPVTLTGTLSGSGGQAIFDVQSAQLGTWPLPRSVLQELIAYYSKSTDYPDGITLGKPFALPAAVQALIIAKGTATVVQ